MASTCGPALPCRSTVVFSLVIDHPAATDSSATMCYVTKMVPMGRLLACLGTNRQCKLYDVEHPSGPAVVVDLEGLPHDVAQLGDSGFLLASIHERKGLAAVDVWDIRAPRAATLSTTPVRGDALCVSGHRDGQRLLAGIGSSVHLWDMRAAEATTAEYDEVHTEDVTALCWRGTGSRFLSASVDGLVCEVDSGVPPHATGEEESDCLLNVMPVGHPVESICLDAHGVNVSVATCDERVEVWSVDGTARTASLSAPGLDGQDARGAINASLCGGLSAPIDHVVGTHWDSENALVVVSGNVNGDAAVHRLTPDGSFNSIAVLPHGETLGASGHVSVVRCHSALPNGGLATGGEDSRVCFWGASLAPSSTRRPTSSRSPPTHQAPY